MTSSIAIINPNQHQSYQKKKGNKGRRKGKKRKKKLFLFVTSVFHSVSSSLILHQQ